MSLSKLVKQLGRDFPGVAFEQGERFAWISSRQTIIYELDGESANLLHELGHALREHRHFGQDIELIKQEREAWDMAITLAERYKTPIDPYIVEDAIESYQTWLLERSKCPRCEQTGVQTQTNTYECINCRCLWSPNEARLNSLRRYRVR